MVSRAYPSGISIAAMASVGLRAIDRWIGPTGEDFDSSTFSVAGVQPAKIRADTVRQRVNEEVDITGKEGINRANIGASIPFCADP